MSNDKPVATAVIKFYANKHVTVELDTITSITPRTLSIAHNILRKTYRGMRGAHNVKLHQKAREDKKKADKDAAEEYAEYHRKRDENHEALAATAAAKGSVPELEASVVETKVPETESE